MKMDADVAFVGLGYIGLPTAVVMAESGLKVLGVDVVQEKVDAVNAGQVTIVEPELEEELKNALESGNFKATTQMPHAKNYVIAVPTPFNDDHSVDMRFIYSAAEAIAPKLEGDELVILESTSPPTTTEKMAARILELRPDLRADGDDSDSSKPVVFFAHCPERILPGKAMEELRTNDRIIGGMSPAAAERAEAVYASFCKGELLKTNDRTAELAKLTENSFRDVNIAFANELSMICDDFGIDVWELIELANHHPRVNILQPGPGVGGHCIAVDPWFIVAASPNLSNLIRTAREVNDSKPEWVLDKINSAINENPTATVALLGLSFKPNIDDLRESPALAITEKTVATFPDNKFLIVEPNINKLPGSLASTSNAVYTQLESALQAADIVALLVDHKEFKELPSASLEGKKVIDTKGIWG
ncbi:UDP-N-acetyl-D-mannosamine dehydrogenase [Corynebacterium pseudogenitalium]|uniref:UDP-N-acetyl-D-mannosamine dehydrogenase n=1 Tax=Corynebacterium pseudogenitalium TaxID=38303 RepID=UPI00210896CC|nr:UDP-N-acetyl-D-mannosamine dehydrogenase [Corynebacterium pseudogenitalium]UUA86700.1 UDP-N-acetyl-D-mannosamine dehydrogenase [Corynebacterium pseudogenitalium]